MSALVLSEKQECSSSWDALSVRHGHALAGELAAGERADAR